MYTCRSKLLPASLAALLLLAIETLDSVADFDTR